MSQNQSNAFPQQKLNLLIHVYDRRTWQVSRKVSLSTNANTPKNNITNALNSFSTLKTYYTHVEENSLFLPILINTPTCMLHSRKVDSVITQTSIRHELWVNYTSQPFMPEQTT